MKLRFKLNLSSALLLAALAALAGCDQSEDKDKPEDGAGETAAETAGTAPVPDLGAPPTLQWYTTCGDPVCGGYDGPWAGVPACAEDSVGAPCATAEATCDFMSDCNARLVCAAEDPVLEGGCPISRARFKQDIAYADPSALQRYYKDLLELRLATYRYRGRSDGRTQLGVILEDGEAELWADPANDRVDLYGYNSLAIAGVQVQAGELAELRAELATLRQELAELRERGDRCASPPG